MSTQYYSDLSNNEPCFLIFGGEGWIAQKLQHMLQNQGFKVSSTLARMENRSAVEAAIKEFKPTHVFNCAGVTGRPNIDWCEDNKQATIRSNVIGTLNLADVCFSNGIHCTVFATGCIYHYDDTHTIGGNGFTEQDPPNFSGSYYSKTKAYVEEIMKGYPNTLTLRLRMPVSDDLHPRNFVTKISKYDRVVNVPNSMSILHDLLPCALLMAQHNETGIYNFTNPGAISHNEVLTLFRDIVRPTFTWKNFSVEEQSTILKAGRSNCELDATKLLKKVREYGVEIPEIHVAYERCFHRMVANGET